MRFLLLGVAIGLACTSAQAADKTPNIQTLQRQMAQYLRDPASAQWRGVYIAHGADGKTRVCGEVNSKNGYGGYAGFQPFVSDLYTPTPGPLFIGTEWASVSVVRESCEGTLKPTPTR